METTPGHRRWRPGQEFAHRPTCSGCPHCRPEFARLLAMDETDAANWLAQDLAARGLRPCGGATNMAHTIRTHTTKSHGPHGPGCTCGRPAERKLTAAETLAFDLKYAREIGPPFIQAMTEAGRKGEIPMERLMALAHAYNAEEDERERSLTAPKPKTLEQAFGRKGQPTLAERVAARGVGENGAPRPPSLRESIGGAR